MQTNGILITVNSLLRLHVKIIQTENVSEIFGNFAEKINFPMNIGHCPDGFQINLYLFGNRMIGKCPDNMLQ